MHYVLFSRAINDVTVNDLLSNLLRISTDQDRDVYLMINSGGGNVTAGIHCHNVMRGLPINLTVHNISNVDSIANVIFLAGGRRIASPASTFMFHSVGFDMNGALRLEERNLRQFLDSVVADNKRMGSIIAGRTNLTEGRAGALFRDQRTHDSAWALRHGFVHSVEDVQIPAGTNVLQLI